MHSIKQSFARCEMMVFTKLRSDSLILLFGERQYEKLGHHVQNDQYISQRLRELGRLLITINKINDTLTTFQHCLFPANMETLICAVKDVAGNDHILITILSLHCFFE